MEVNPQFWQALDQLLARCPIVIDRPKGTVHPQFSDMIYPLDYGYLQGTHTMDGEDIDLWQGSAPKKQLDGLLCVVDLPKGEIEIKLLLDCTEEEKRLAFHFQNKPPHMVAQLVRRL